MKAYYVKSRPLLPMALLGLLVALAHWASAAGPDPIDEARKAYNNRSAAAVSQLSAAERALDASVSGIADKDQRYDALILESRMLYFIGMHTDGASTKMEIFANGRKAADAAETIDPRFADSAYYAAINLGRWGEANGGLLSIKVVPTLKAYLATAASRKTRDGKPGDSIDNAGPHRMLGGIYDRLPGLMGGSRSKALEEFGKATAMAPERALNTVDLAATLMEGKDAEKAEGRQKLQALLQQDPKTLNPSMIPETEDEFVLARRVLAGQSF